MCSYSICKRLRLEFSKKYIGFNVPADCTFFTFCWLPQQTLQSRILFLLYRVILAVYVGAWYIKIVSTKGWSTFPIMSYLTVWTYFLMTLYLTYTACVVIVIFALDWKSIKQKNKQCKESSTMEHSFLGGRKDQTLDQCNNPSDDDCPDVERTMFVRSKSSNIEVECMQSKLMPLQCVRWYFIIQWIMFDVLIVLSPMISAVYWGILFHAFKKTDVIDIHLHAVNLLVMCCEFWVTDAPVRLCHIIFPFIYSFIYLVFSVCFWVVDHDNLVYGELLDWSQPGKAMRLVGLVVAAILFFQVINFFLFLARLRLIKACRNTKLDRTEEISLEVKGC